MLLVIHLFNMGGYRIVFSLLEEKSHTHFVNKLDKGSYDDQELIELKVPYPLPYAASWPEYQRYDGEIELNGVHYNYVKRKMLNDTLYLLCIPNTVKTDLQTAKQELTASLSDNPNQHSKEQKSSVPAVTKPYAPEYNNQPAEFRFGLIMSTLINGFAFSETRFTQGFISSPFQPPKA